MSGQLLACWGTYFPDTTDDAGCVGGQATQWVTATVCQTFDGAVWAISWSPSLCATGRPVPLDGDGGSVDRSNHCAGLSCDFTGSRHAMWKIGCVIAVSLLCGCTDAVYMRNASGETVKCGSVYTSLAGDFESMGIAARESQCIQDYKDQGFRRVPCAG